MRLGVRLLGLGPTLFEARIAELVRRVRDGERPDGAARLQQAQSEEVSDGKRRVGAAAGDLHAPD